MPHNDTPWMGSQADKVYLQSGQFASTVRTSQSVNAFQIGPLGISWDGSNTPISGNGVFKLHLISGQFSSTVKDSEDLTGQVILPHSVSWDAVDSPWCGFGGGVGKLLLQSGQFTSAIKTSLDVTAVDTTPTGISADGTNTPWTGSTDDKLYLQSGQFSSTVKDSEDISGIENLPGGISYDGTNTPWSGRDNIVGNVPKLFLQSGQFTSTIKTSRNVDAIDTQLMDNETNALNVSCDVAGTIVSAATDEDDIVAGGKTIILTLNTGRLPPQSDIWHANIGSSSSQTTDLINGLTSSGAEAAGWNAVVRAGLTFADVTRDSDTQVTILLPAFALYDITATELITATIPASALDGGNGPLTAEPSFAVEVVLPGSPNDTTWCEGGADEKLILTSGQFSSTIKTSEDVSGIDSPIGVAFDGTNTPWATTDGNSRLLLQSGQFSSTVKDSEDVNAIDSDIADISSDGTNTPWIGNSANKLYLQSGQFTSTLKTSEAIGALDFTPRGISWDGTNTPWCGDLNTTTFGGKLYLQSGQFTSTLKDSEAVEAIDNAIHGISFSSGNTPWIGAGDDKLYLQSGQFTSTIKTSEDISGVTDGPTGIDANDRLAAGGPVAVAVSGSIIPSAEADIRDGGNAIVLTLSGDTWEATLGADNAITQALIDGLVSAQSEAKGWNAIVQVGLNATHVTRQTDTLVIIDLPAFTTYDISDDETITVTIPASALSTTVTAVVAAPTFSISAIPVSPAPRPPIRAFYRDSEFLTYISPDGVEYPLNTPHTPGRFVLNQTGWGTPPIDYITQRSPFQDGVTVRDFFLGPRVIQLLIRQNFCDRDGWWDGRGALLDSIRPNRQLTDTGVVRGTLRRCLPDGSLRDLRVFITEGPRFEPRRQAVWDEHSFQEVLRFIAHDPVVFDPNRIDANFPLTGVPSELVFPIDFPIEFGSGDISDTLTITYVGTWKSFPVIVITGPIDTPRIDNLTTGEKLELSADVSPGQIVTIDLSPEVKTVTDNLGANLIGSLTTDSDLQTFHIAPNPEAPLGVNQLTLTGSNPTGSTAVQVRYFTRYFGI